MLKVLILHIEIKKLTLFITTCNNHSSFQVNVINLKLEYFVLFTVNLIL